VTMPRARAASQRTGAGWVGSPRQLPSASTASEERAPSAISPWTAWWRREGVGEESEGRRCVKCSHYPYGKEAHVTAVKNVAGTQVHGGPGFGQRRPGQGRAAWRA